MSKMEQLDLFGGKPTKLHTRAEWVKAFVKRCEKIYEKEGETNGKFCCGYHWCCNKCRCLLARGCADCVATIEEILITNGVHIDYNDFNFDYWEKKASELI